VIFVVSQISVLCSRLEFAAPAVKPLGEGLSGVVNRLIEGAGAPDEEFRKRLGKVRTAFRAINCKRDARRGVAARRRLGPGAAAGTTPRSPRMLAKVR